MDKQLPTIRFLPRHQINALAWDTCVAASARRIVYGLSWYLDAVLPAPDWKWIGLVMPGETGGYRAVMPVPLRRKLGRWVVHQPLFCQWLGVFSPDDSLDPKPFFRAVPQRFRYGSALHLNQYPGVSLLFGARQMSTQILDLSIGYDTLYQNYSPDRRRNLRRARAANWTIIDSTDPEPLLTLFRDNHAGSIEGGVGEWAYAIFRTLMAELRKRNLATLRYAVRQGRVEAGALFVRDGNRIIYLFNSASEMGRRGNARTWLIDEVIRENTSEELIFDFESPEKLSIRSFYRSFGAVEEAFWQVRWNRLTRSERLVLNVFRPFRT